MTTLTSEQQGINEVEDGIERLIPQEVCRGFTMIPFSTRGNVLIVATDNVENKLAATVASQVTGLEVELVYAGADEVNQAIDLVFGSVLLSTPSGESDEAEAQPLTGLSFEDIVLRAGLVSEEQIAVARAEQDKTGSRLGDILTASKVITEDDLVAVLSEQYDIQRVSLDGFEADAETVEIIPEALAFYLHCLPVSRDDSRLFVAVTRPLEQSELEVIAEYTSLEIHQLLATATSIDVVLQTVYGERFVDASVNSLIRSTPQNSAHQVLSSGQRVFFIAALVVVALCLILWTMPTLIGLTALASVYYIAVSLYRFTLIWRTIGKQSGLDITREEIDALDEKDLPVITILVPLYREAAVVPNLVHGISGLDYPKTKLDVKLLCEEDDDETVPAIQKLNLPPFFKLVIVPEAQPKTKPKACNYGLFLAEGKYITIFDAEDRPEPDQLKKVVVAFNKSDDALVCVQSKLNYFNQEQNLLTKWFSIEYATHFDLVLPGLAEDRVPIPLGGTSNYLVTEKLRELGAWDPFNVTEDADLGVRLHKANYHTAVVDSVTLEEANSDLNNWIRQRSRWIKGYYQTWLVHMRNPVKLLSEVGPKGFMSFNLVIGGTFTFLLNPIFWGLTTLYVFTQAGFIAELFPGIVFYMGILAWFVGNFMFLYVSVAGTLQRGFFNLTVAALLSPIYWGMMSWAAYKAMIQLFTNPFYWEKTIHGLDSGSS